MADRDTRQSGGKKKDQLSVKVMLPPCRMSFPHLFKPQDTDNGERYQANFLFPPKTDFSKLEDAMDEVMTDFFGPKDDWPRGKQDRLPRDVIRDATEKNYEGYNKGWDFIKAASRDPVGIVDAQRQPVTNEREIYGGRWCRISVTVRAYDNKSKGVGIYLNSVQVLDHDEQFGGRGPAKNDFEDWDGDPLSPDDRGTGTGSSSSSSRDGDRDDRGDDRGSRRGGWDDDRSGRDRGREDDRRDTRERGRDDRDREDDRGTRRPADDDRRGSRRGDDDDRGSRGRDDRDRDSDRGRDRDRPSREEPRGSGRDRDREDEPRGGRDGRQERSRDDRDADTRGRGRRDEPEDDRPSRGRDRDREDDRPSGRGRNRDEEWN